MRETSTTLGSGVSPATDGKVDIPAERGANAPSMAASSPAASTTDELPAEANATVDSEKCCYLFKSVVSEALHTVDEYRRRKWSDVGATHLDGAWGGGGPGAEGHQTEALLGDRSELTAASDLLRNMCTMSTNMRDAVFKIYLDRAGVFYEVYAKLVLTQTFDVESFTDLITVGDFGDEERLCRMVFDMPSAEIDASAEEKSSAVDGMAAHDWDLKRLPLYDSSWKCDTCLVRNKNEIDKCLCCGSVKQAQGSAVVPKAAAISTEAATTAATMELKPIFKTALKEAFDHDFVAPLAELVSGKLLSGLKQMVANTVCDAPLFSLEIEQTRKLLTFMTVIETAREPQGRPPLLDNKEGQSTTGESQATPAPVPLPTSAGAMATEPPKPAGASGNAGGSSASRVQVLWGEVVSEFVSNTLLMMTGFSKDYVDRVHEALVRLSRLHVLFPRHLRHSGRLAIAAAFRRLRPVETCTVVQHFHARLSHLLDSLRSDDELGVTATRTRRGLLSEICDVLRELDLGEAALPFFKTYLGKRLLRDRSITLDLESMALREIDPSQRMGVTPRTMLRDVIESKRQHEPWIQYCLKNWSSWLEAEQTTALGRRRSLRASHGRAVRGGGLETGDYDEALLSLELVDGFHPIVITRSEWPSVLVPMTPVTLPLKMSKLCDRFASFYRNPAGWQGSGTEALSVVGAGEAGSGLAIGSGHVSRKGHKIIWSPTSGSVTLGVSYFSSTNDTDVQLSGEIVLSVVQACILLLFNEARSVTFSFMLDNLGLSEDRLYSDLRALVAPAQPLLVTSLVNFWRLPYARINLDELRASEFVLNREFITVRFGNVARSDRGGRAIPRGRSPPPSAWSPNAIGRSPACTSSTSAISDGTVHPAAPLVVHEVRDALADALADATAASQLFAWQEEKVKASAVRILKSRSKEPEEKTNPELSSQAETLPEKGTCVKAALPGAPKQEDRELVGRGLVFTEVVDMVMQHCRENVFDVEKSTVFKALESLCKDGLVERIVVEGELTKLRLVPPEEETIAEKTDMIVLKDTLSKMKETKTVTGKNLYHLLLVKIQMDIATPKISFDDLTVGLIKLVLPRAVSGINEVLTAPRVADGTADDAAGGGGDAVGGGGGTGDGADLGGGGEPATPAGGLSAGGGGFGLGTGAGAAAPPITKDVALPNATITPENVPICFWNMKVIYHQTVDFRSARV